MQKNDRIRVRQLECHFISPNAAQQLRFCHFVLIQKYVKMFPKIAIEKWYDLWCSSISLLPTFLYSKLQLLYQALMKSMKQNTSHSRGETNIHLKRERKCSENVSIRILLVVPFLNRQAVEMAKSAGEEAKPHTITQRQMTLWVKID